MDLLQTGHSHTELEESKKIGEGLLDLVKAAGPRGIKDRALLEQINHTMHQSQGKHLTYERLKQVLHDLANDGDIRIKDNLVKLV